MVSNLAYASSLVNWGKKKFEFRKSRTLFHTRAHTISIEVCCIYGLYPYILFKLCLACVGPLSSNE